MDVKLERLGHALGQRSAPLQARDDGVEEDVAEGASSLRLRPGNGGRGRRIAPEFRRAIPTHTILDSPRPDPDHAIHDKVAEIGSAEVEKVVIHRSTFDSSGIAKVESPNASDPNRCVLRVSLDPRLRR
ncbi:MAG: hypothetical protein AAF721_25525, partial [Myxococcota bacterium]